MFVLLYLVNDSLAVCCLVELSIILSTLLRKRKTCLALLKKFLVSAVFQCHTLQLYNSKLSMVLSSRLVFNVVVNVHGCGHGVSLTECRSVALLRLRDGDGLSDLLHR